MSIFARYLRAPALSLIVALSAAAPAAADSTRDAIDRQLKAVESKMIAWRRDIHQDPELGNRELRTGALVAAHLKTLGYEVQEKVAKTGVVAVLKGGRPGPVIALRADMDALPVTEEVDIPFASKAKANWGGREVGVMHACGHDAHTAILMAAAEVLAALKSELPGTVKLIFQPAEEGPPPGEQGGAQLMIAEGVLENPKPEAVFALHMVAGMRTGTIAYRAGPILAGADTFSIVVRGRQTHGAMPWNGVDPIVLGAQIVLALQTIQSRQVDVTTAPSILTVGIFNAGNRTNIIPDKAELAGTLRTYDPQMREFIMRRVKETAELVAKSGGGEAEVKWSASGYIALVNNPALTNRMVPSLKRAAGDANVFETKPITASEDFSFYAQKIPSFYFFIGVTPQGTMLTRAAPNHSPRFFVDEAALPTALRALVYTAFDYAEGKK